MKEELQELFDAVLEMGSVNGDAVSAAAAQERLIHALDSARQALQPPLLLFAGQENRMPTRAHNTDAGFDLYVDLETHIPPGKFVDVELGIRVEFPRGWWGRLIGRSSTLRKKGLLVAEGTIDEGYRGPLYAGVWNMTDDWIGLFPGERIAQLIMCRTPPEMQVERVAELSWSERGDAGFGSTGA